MTLKKILLFVIVISFSSLNSGKNKKKRNQIIHEEHEVIYDISEELKKHLHIVESRIMYPENIKIKIDETSNQRRYRLEIDIKRAIVAAQQQTLDGLQSAFYEINNTYPDYQNLQEAIQSLKQKNINTFLSNKIFCATTQNLLSMHSDSDYSEISRKLSSDILSLMSYENGFTQLQKTALQMLQYGNLLHEFVRRLIELNLNKDNIEKLKHAFFCAYATPYYKYLKEFNDAFLQKDINHVADLLKEGALPTWHVTKNGHIPLTIAINNEAFCLTELLLYCPNVDINAQNQHGDSALIIAAKKRNFALAQLLLKEFDYRYDEQAADFIEFQSVNLDIQNKQGETALITAIKESATNIAELILSYKPNKNLCDKTGHDAYYWAHLKNNQKIIQLLEL